MRRPSVAVLGAVVIVVLAVIALRSSSGRDEDQTVYYSGLAVTGYAHEHEPWAPDHFREENRLRMVPDPYLGTRLDGFRSRTINIRDGVRVSYTPKHPTLTVWFFGGSTMFGVGQRDDHTIPSVVARLAAKDGIGIRAVNFGVPGDVNWQETQRFAEALTSALRTPPGLVVFYDGSNDRALATYARIAAGSGDAEVIDRHAFSSAESARWHRSAGGPIPRSAATGDLGVELAAVQYRRGVDVARRLAAAHTIPVVHVWQPTAAAKKPTSADGELWERLGWRVEDLGRTTREYTRMREESGVEPIDLSKVFDELTVPVYFDPVHTNELGARIVAEALYAHLRPELTRLGRLQRPGPAGG